MIVEGIITTIASNGGPHITPLGPEFSNSDPTRIVLKPFQTSSTFLNLTREPKAVFHFVDDALLLARAACGVPNPCLIDRAANGGWVLQGACTALELEILEVDDSQERARIPARIVRSHQIKHFGGWNRAQFAVLEGAILLSRVFMLGLSRVNDEMDRLEILVKKTAGPNEWEAWRLIRETAQARGGQS